MNKTLKLITGKLLLDLSAAVRVKLANKGWKFLLEGSSNIEEFVHFFQQHMNKVGVPVTIQPASKRAVRIPVKVVQPSPAMGATSASVATETFPQREDINILDQRLPPKKAYKN